MSEATTTGCGLFRQKRCEKWSWFCLESPTVGTCRPDMHWKSMFPVDTMRMERIGDVQYRYDIIRRYCIKGKERRWRDGAASWQIICRHVNHVSCLSITLYGT